MFVVDFFFFFFLNHSPKTKKQKEGEDDKLIFGYVQTLGSVLQLIGSPLLGMAMDARGYKWGLLVSQVLFLLCFVSLFLLFSFSFFSPSLFLRLSFFFSLFGAPSWVRTRILMDANEGFLFVRLREGEREDRILNECPVVGCCVLWGCYVLGCVVLLYCCIVVLLCVVVCCCVLLCVVVLLCCLCCLSFFHFGFVVLCHIVICCLGYC